MMQPSFSYKRNILYWLKIKYGNIQIVSETEGFTHLGYLFVSSYLTSFLTNNNIQSFIQHSGILCFNVGIFPTPPKCLKTDSNFKLLTVYEKVIIKK